MGRNSGFTLLMALTALAAPSASFAQTPGKLVLQIHQVLCIKETSSGFLIGTHGDDHMILGGITVTPSGKKTQINAVGAGTFEEAGRHETFNPPKVFASVPVSTGKLREYSVVLVLAEQDVKGGTDRFVASLLKDTGPADTDSDKADGGATAVAGEVAKEVAKELAKAALKRLEKNAEDDIFPTRTVTVTLRESDRRFADGQTSTPRQETTFNGHGGRYTVIYSWKLVS